MAGRNSRLETKWEKIARTFSRNHDVNIRLTGSGCSADLKTGTIYIPANADDYKDLDVQLLEGLVDHEWKHIEVEKVARDAGHVTPLDYIKKMTQAEKLWFNVFEDYRIEAELSHDYVGCGENVAFMNDQLFGINKKKCEVTPMDPMMAIGMTILGRLQNRDTNWLPDEAQKLADELEPIWKQADDMKNYEDAIALTKQIIEKLGEIKEQNEADDEDQDQGNGDQESENETGGGGFGDGEGNEDESETGGDANQDDEESDEKDDNGTGGGDQKDQTQDDNGDGEGDGDNGDEDEDEDSDADSNGDDGAGAGQDIDPATADYIRRAFNEKTVDDIKTDIKEHLKQAAEKNAKENMRHIAHPAMDKMDRIRVAVKGTPVAFKAIRQEVNKQVSALKSKLVSLLRTKTLKGAVLDREHGHLDGGALYRLKMADRNVFMEPAKNLDLDTVVSMLIDMSGSMGAQSGGVTRIVMAVRAATALAETMDQLDVPVEITGFRNDGVNYGTINKLKSESDIYTRHVPFVRTIFKTFGERWQTVKTRMAGDDARGRGVNCDGEAVLWAAKRLAARNERRKILIVLSDGKPNLESGLHIQKVIKYDLKEQVGHIIRAGIQVIGLGIMSDCVADYYPVYTIINDLSDLPKEMFKALKRFMV